MRESSPVASNWRADQTLRDYLDAHNIVAIADIDTRALTRKLRSGGVHARRHRDRRGSIREQLVERARAIPQMEGARPGEGRHLRGAVRLAGRRTTSDPRLRRAAGAPRRSAG